MNKTYGMWEQSEDNSSIYFAKKTLRLEILEDLVKIFIYYPYDFEIAEIPYRTNEELEDILDTSQNMLGMKAAFEKYKNYLDK